jgi:protein SCO1/2
MAQIQPGGKPMDRKNILFLTLVALIIIGIAIYQYALPPMLHGAVIDPPKPMPVFTLASAKGPVSLNDFGGKVTVIFFGFTNCMDVCPATMAKLSDALNRLGDKAGGVQVVFISVDYRRDTPQSVGAYAARFRPDFIGLTGTQAEIDRVTKDYGIYYKLGEADASGNYEVEHTAIVMALDKQGRLQMTWASDQQPDEIASDLGVLLGR